MKRQINYVSYNEAHIQHEIVKEEIPKFVKLFCIGMNCRLLTVCTKPTTNHSEQKAISKVEVSKGNSAYRVIKKHKPACV